MVTAIRSSTTGPLNPFFSFPVASARPSQETEANAFPRPSQTSASSAEEKDSPAVFEKSGAEDSKPALAQTEEELTEEEQREVDRLKAEDRKVRQHEQAHLAAAGPYARGGAQLEYTIGPDGKQYAVGGEVTISTSRESTPETTLKKARTIRRAALAPAEPSSQDRRVAAQASQLEREALSQIAQESRAESLEKRDSPQAGAGATPSSENRGTAPYRPERESPLGRNLPVPTPFPAAEIFSGSILDLIG